MSKKKQRPNRVSLLGEEWGFYRTHEGVGRKAEGECDNPLLPKRGMRVRPNVKGKRELEYILHEAHHAVYWHHVEKHVKALNEDLADLLWRCGYRRLPELDEFL